MTSATASTEDSAEFTGARRDSLKASRFAGRLFIHVGPHKTGTTTIQHFLSDNAPMLREHGVLYPRAGRGKQAPAQHWNLGEAVITGDIARLNSILADIDSEAEDSGCRTIVLSSEVLSRKNVGTEELSLLVSAFPDAERIWIAVLRRQDELLPSLYAEQLKKGIIGFPEDYRKISGPEFLDHVRRLETIAAASEADPLLVARFADIKKDLVGNFLQMIGLPTVAKTPPDASGHRNRAIPGRALRVLRYANALPPPLRNFARNRLISISREHAGLFGGAALDREELNGVQMRYEPGNAAIEAAFFGQDETKLCSKPCEGSASPAHLPDRLHRQVIPWPSAAAQLARRTDR